MEEKQTFDSIYQEHVSMVFNLCLSYLQNKELAEEVTQDVFLKVYEKRRHFEKRSSLKTWIYRIAINKSLDAIKATKRKKRFGFKLSISGEDAPYNSLLWNMDHPGVLLEDKEGLASLFACINLLPEKQKTALLLRSVDGLSPVEASEVMSISIKALDSLMSRAKKKLIKLINETKENP